MYFLLVVLPSASPTALYKTKKRRIFFVAYILYPISGKLNIIKLMTPSLTIQTFLILNVSHLVLPLTSEHIVMKRTTAVGSEIEHRKPKKKRILEKNEERKKERKRFILNQLHNKSYRNYLYIFKKQLYLIKEYLKRKSARRELSKIDVVARNKLQKF